MGGRYSEIKRLREIDLGRRDRNEIQEGETQRYRDWRRGDPDRVDSLAENPKT